MPEVKYRWQDICTTYYCNADLAAI